MDLQASVDVVLAVIPPESILEPVGSRITLYDLIYNIICMMMVMKGRGVFRKGLFLFGFA